MLPMLCGLILFLLNYGHFARFVVESSGVPIAALAADGKQF